MSNSKLPERASLEYLKKLAKDRLQELRRADPRAKLADRSARRRAGPRVFQLACAEGRSSSSGSRRTSPASSRPVLKGTSTCCAACLRTTEAWLVSSNPDAPHQGWTGSTRQPRAGTWRPSGCCSSMAPIRTRARPETTHTRCTGPPPTAHLEVVRALLDAGGDVHGVGDVHELDVIGWATLYRAPGMIPLRWTRRGASWSLLLERGARHHIFSAMCVGDLELIRKLVEQNPEALDRRMSRFEHGLTPLHFAISRKRYDILDLLIELGADLEAKDMSGQTALAVAMLRGDREAMSRLHAAGRSRRRQLPRRASGGHGASWLTP